MKIPRRKAVGKKEVTANFKGSLRADQRFLMDASALLFSSLDYGVTLSRVAELTLSHLADWCAIYLISEKGDIELFTIAHKNPKKARIARILQKNKAIDPKAHTGVARVIRTGKPEFHAHITPELLRSLARNHEHFKILRSMEMQSRMIVPLIARNKILGSITLASTNPRRLYTKTDLAVAEELARRAAIAIDNAHLFNQSQDEIAHRKLAEKKLRDSNIKLSKLLESTSDAFISVDREWRYTYLNKHAEVIERVSRADVLGKKMWDVFPEAKKTLFYKKYYEAMQSGKPVEFEEFIDGRWFEIRVHPFEDGLSVYYRDVTDKKQFEERKDEFISMASHELKTPITSLKLFTELFSHPISAKHRHEYVVQIQNQVDKLNKLVNDLLDVSKMQVGKLEFKKKYFDFTALIKMSVKTMQASQANHTIKLVIPRRRLRVWGDEDRIEQVLTNLLSNASKYSPGKNKIIVRVVLEDKSLVVSVQDFGVGIDVPLQNKIFNRFYQVAGKKGHTFPGLGIGLYISKLIIDNHQGNFEVKSEVGKGSTFSFMIPCVAEERPTRAGKHSNEKK